MNWFKRKAEQPSPDAAEVKAPGWEQYLVDLGPRYQLTLSREEVEKAGMNDESLQALAFKLTLYLQKPVLISVTEVNPRIK